jgi:predicted PurR-regulated permease PerM
MQKPAKTDADERTGQRRSALPVDAHSRQSVRTFFALALIALAAWIAADFLPALAWAIVIAITTWPLYLRLATLIPPPSRNHIAPALFTLIVGVVLLIPLMLALQQLAQASDAAMRWIGELQKGGLPVPPWVAQLPLTGDLMVDWWRKNLSDPAAASQWLRGINLESATGWTRALGGELLHRLLLFVVTLLALFFLYRDGGCRSPPPTASLATQASDWPARWSRRCAAPSTARSSSPWSKASSSASAMRWSVRPIRSCSPC